MHEIEKDDNNDLIGVKKFRQLACKQIVTFESGMFYFC